MADTVQSPKMEGHAGWKRRGSCDCPIRERREVPLPASRTTSTRSTTQSRHIQAPSAAPFRVSPLA